MFVCVIMCVQTKHTEPNVLFTAEVSMKHFGRNYLMELVGDRSKGGGREQVAAAMGNTFTVSDMANLGDHPLIKAMKSNHNNVLGFAGIGTDESECSGSRLLNYDREGALIGEYLSGTHHQEDTKLIYLAILDVLQGRNVLIKADDTDIWMIAMLILSKYINQFHTMGTLFVETTNRIVDGHDTNLINCNEAALSVLKCEKLSHIENAEVRMFTFVTVCIALGGDTTHATMGVSHQKGVPNVLKYLKCYIGNLVIPATDEEAEEGWFYMIDFEAYKRMTMVIFMELHHTNFCDHWDSKSEAERCRWMTDLGYVEMEKQVASFALLKFAFMPSVPNLKFCKGRSLTRAHTWYVADFNSTRQVPLMGFEATEYLGHGLGGGFKRHSEPHPDMIPYDKCSMAPQFTRNEKGELMNTPFNILFPGDGGTFGALYAQRLRESAKKGKSKRTRCSKCSHAYHGDEDCAQCLLQSNGLSSCIEACKKCFHKLHKGKKCPDCAELVKGRENCVSFCRGCRIQTASCSCDDTASSSPSPDVGGIDNSDESESNDQVDTDYEEDDGAGDDVLGALTQSAETHGRLLEVVMGGADDESRVAFLENTEDWDIEIDD